MKEEDNQTIVCCNECKEDDENWDDQDKCEFEPDNPKCKGHNTIALSVGISVAVVLLIAAAIAYVHRDTISRKVRELLRRNPPPQPGDVEPRHDNVPTLIELRKRLDRIRRAEMQG